METMWCLVFCEIDPMHALLLWMHVNRVLKHHSVNKHKLSQLSLSQFKLVKCRKKPKTFQTIDVLKLCADNNNNKTQVYDRALCQWTCASAFEIFGDMLKRHRLNCCIKNFTEIAKHWCFDGNSWSKHQCFNKNTLLHLCLIHIWF